MPDYANQLINILMVEDEEGDVRLFSEIMKDQLQPEIQIRHVPNLKEATGFLQAFSPDVILLDLNLPDGRGLDSFVTLRDACSQPIIVLSGLNDEQLAIQAVHEGAQDYLVKWESNQRQMMRAIIYAIERHNLMSELEAARKEIQSLRNLIPICSYCRRVRHDDGFWQALESYVAQIGNIDFSHGICPECYERVEEEELSQYEAPDQP